MDSEEIINRHLISSEKAHKNRKRLRWALYILAVLVLGTLLWVGVNAVSAVQKISRVAHPFAGLFSKQTELKGQAEGRTNFLILGRGGAGHAGGQLTDTIIFASYDRNSKQVALVSIPRDLYVPIAREGGKNKINSAYTYGLNNFKDDSNAPADIAAETVSNILAQPVHYWVVLDFVGFKKLVDTLDGVKIIVDKTIDDPYYPAEYFKEDQYVKTEDYERFYLKAGEQELDGETALKYARSRETTSDFDRAKRQQKVLMAFKDKAVSAGVLGNPKKIVDILGILGDHIRINLSVAEVEAAVKLTRELDNSKVITRVLDNRDDGLLTNLAGEGGYYLGPKSGNFKEIQEFVKNIFSEEVIARQMPSPPPVGETSGEVLGAVSEKTLINLQNGTGEPGTARQFSDKLKEASFTIYSLTTAPQTIEKTLIYVYKEDENPETTKALQTFLPQAQVIRYPDADNPVDYRIILGQDFIL